MPLLPEGAHWGCMKKADLEKFIRPFRVTGAKGFDLDDFDPADTGSFRSKSEAAGLLDQGVARMGALQEKLYADGKWALLLIFQAMDAAGKDSTIKHVMSGINPQGCQVHSFKAPTSTELGHDYLWRNNTSLPERGRIGIFNRSYYEEVLVVRVHPGILQQQKIPACLIHDKIWDERHEDIAAYERYLGRNGVVVRKFFLHVSKKAQKERFLERIDQKEKNWKFSSTDVREREHWKEYQKAYQEVIRATATPAAPWFVVPADHKWFTRLVVSAAIVETLESLDLRFPTIEAGQKKELISSRRLLEAE